MTRGALYDGRFFQRGKSVLWESWSWTDLRPNTVSVGAASAALSRARINGPNTPQYDHFVRGQTDELIYSFQMPHLWAPNDLRPHLHVMPTSAEVGADDDLIGTVLLFFRWAWTGYRSGLKMPSIWSEIEIELPITVGDQMEELLVGPLLTPPQTFTEHLSGHLHVWCGRAGADVRDDYNADGVTSVAANLAFISADCHATMRDRGSREEYLM